MGFAGQCAARVVPKNVMSTKTMSPSFLTLKMSHAPRKRTFYDCKTKHKITDGWAHWLRRFVGLRSATPRTENENPTQDEMRVSRRFPSDLLAIIESAEGIVWDRGIALDVARAATAGEIR